ncbi:YetF domain-containing protein [Paenibacillus tyrfis]|uniref:YetF domain-containing protein n=1 Tax=Paenibacillus tyrfis TaxID=1501230 RepID=UPI0020A0CA3E|nr:YetF domain-containing protein [Paenibacillus tyrfis]MCP1310765.1 DUF421 domain-containing protein [Paenibacillus tyrfis]
MYLPTELIADGKIVKKNLKELQLNREWLEEQIKRLGAQSIHEVFFAELQSDGSITLDKKSNGRPVRIEFGPMHSFIPFWEKYSIYSR